MIGHLCKCCKEKQEIKYTNVDDINNLINQFSANITKKWGQDLLRQEIYDLYHDTIKDDTVTMRNRDTMLQERVSINQLPDLIREKLDA